MSFFAVDPRKSRFSGIAVLGERIINFEEQRQFWTVELKPFHVICSCFVGIHSSSSAHKLRARPILKKNPTRHFPEKQQLTFGKLTSNRYTMNSLHSPDHLALALSKSIAVPLHGEYFYHRGWRTRRFSEESETFKTKSEFEFREITTDFNDSKKQMPFFEAYCWLKLQ